MGGSGSKSITDIAAACIIKVAVNASSNTSQAVSGSMTFSGVTISGSNITQNTQAIQNAIINMQITNDLMNKIMTEMKQMAEASSSALTVAIADNESKIRTTLQTVLTSDFKASVSQAVSNYMLFDKGTLIKNSNITNALTASQKTVSSFLNNNTAWNQVANEVDQKASSTSSLLDIFGPGSGTWILVIVGLMFLAFIYFKFIKGGST